MDRPDGPPIHHLPGGGLFFPALVVPTGELIVPEEAPRATARGVMMPRRRRTRADDRNYRRSRERRLNEQRLAEEQRQRESWLAATYEPPPF